MRLSVTIAALVPGIVLASSSGAADMQRQFDMLDRRAATIHVTAQEALPASVRAATGYPAVRYGGDYAGPYLDIARQMALAHHVPEGLFLRLVQQESGWNPGAVSPKGAVGLAQLMPETAAVLGVDARDPRQNLEGGARYLRMQFETFLDWRLALAAYNAGPEAVKRYGGVPPYAETRAYVVAILGE